MQKKETSIQLQISALARGRVLAASPPSRPLGSVGPPRPLAPAPLVRILGLSPAAPLLCHPSGEIVYAASTFAAAIGAAPPHAQRVFPCGAVVLALALSRDGALLAAGTSAAADACAAVLLFDFASARLVRRAVLGAPGAALRVQPRGLAFNCDASILAAVALAECDGEAQSSAVALINLTSDDEGGGTCACRGSSSAPAVHRADGERISRLRFSPFDPASFITCGSQTSSTSPPRGSLHFWRLAASSGASCLACAATTRSPATGFEPFAAFSDVVFEPPPALAQGGPAAISPPGFAVTGGDLSLGCGLEPNPDVSAWAGQRAGVASAAGAGPGLPHARLSAVVRGEIAHEALGSSPLGVLPLSELARRRRRPAGQHLAGVQRQDTEAEQQPSESQLLLQSRLLSKSALPHVVSSDSVSGLYVSADESGSAGQENARGGMVSPTPPDARPIRTAEQRASAEYVAGEFEKGLRVFACTAAGTVVQVGADSRRVEGVFRLHDASVTALEMSASAQHDGPPFGAEAPLDGQGFAATADSAGCVRLWDSGFSGTLWEATLGSAVRELALVCKGTGPDGGDVPGLRWDSHSRRRGGDSVVLAAIVDDEHVVGGGAEGREIHELSDGGGGGFSLVLVRARLDSAAAGAAVRAMVVVAESHGSPIVGAALATPSSGALLATAASDGSVRVWPMPHAAVPPTSSRATVGAAALVRTPGYLVRDSHAHATCIAVRRACDASSPLAERSDGRREALLHAECSLGLPTSLVLPRAFEHDTSALDAGRRAALRLEAAVGMDDGSIDVISLSSASLLCSVRPHAAGARVSAVVWSSQGGTLYSAGCDGRLVASSSAAGFRVSGMFAAPGFPLRARCREAMLSLSPRGDVAAVCFSRPLSSSADDRDDLPSERYLAVVRTADFALVASCGGGKRAATESAAKAAEVRLGRTSAPLLSAPPTALCCVSDDGDLVVGTRDGRLALLGFEANVEQEPAVCAARHLGAQLCCLAPPVRVCGGASSAVAALYYERALGSVSYALADGRQGSRRVAELRAVFRDIDAEICTSDRTPRGVEISAALDVPPVCMLASERAALLGGSPITVCVSGSAVMLREEVAQ